MVSARQPAAFERLQAELAEGDVVAAVALPLSGRLLLAGRPAADDAALALSELDPLGHLWHGRSLPLAVERRRFTIAQPCAGRRRRRAAAAAPRRRRGAGASVASAMSPVR